MTTHDQLKGMTIEEMIAKKSPKLTPAQREKQADVLKKMIFKGIPLRDSLEITPDVMEFLYAEGRRLYMVRKYTECLKYFYLLYLLYPLDPRFAFGVAGSYHMQKNYKLAIPWYFTLAMTDLDSPLAYYHTSDCFLKQGDKESGLFFLQKALERIGEDVQYDQLKERILRMVPPLEAALAKEKV